MLGYVHLCKTKKITYPPFIELEEDKCTEQCNENNPTYVTFLNNYIHEIQNLLFLDNDTSVLELHTIPSNTNMCVDTDEDTCVCVN